MNLRRSAARAAAALALLAIAAGVVPVRAQTTTTTSASPAASSSAGTAPTATPYIPASPIPTAPPDNLQTQTLANGLRIIVAEDHAAPVVQTGVWYRFGSLDETPGKTGLAHALEHMMFRGTPSLSGAGLDDISARLGAQTNANTSNDYTHFYFVFPSSQAELAIRVEADRMRHLDLSERDWQLEKGAVLSEIDSDLSDPTGQLYYKVREAAFPNSPYALTALGRRADVVRSTAADLRTYYNEWYHPNDATLVVTGDVRADDVFRWASTYFGSYPRVAPPRVTVAPPTSPTNAQVSVNADYPYRVIDLAYRIPGDLDPGAGEAAIIPQVINNQRSAFYPALVQSGIALDYSAFGDTQLHAGLLHVFITLAPGKDAAQARSVFERTLTALGANVPADLVDAAKRGALSQAIYARDAVTSLGDRVGYATGVELHPPSVDDAKIAAVTPASVARVIASTLQTPNVVGVLNPQHGKPAGNNTTPGSGVSDNFSSRVPNGPIVEAPWVKTALAKPLTATSTVEPRRYTLANGITLLVQPIHNNPTVYLSGTIRTSPRFQSAANAGLGGLAAALMNYGSTKYDFATQRRITDELAANVTLGTDFGIQGFSRDFPALLDLLADGLTHPSYPAQFVQLVKSQELAAISQRNNDPDYQAQQTYLRLLLPKRDPALIEPSAASVSSANADAMRAYATKYFRPDTTTIAVAGDVDPDRVRDQIATAFGTWSNDGPTPSFALPAIPAPRPTSAYVFANRTAVNVRSGQPAIARSSPDFYPLNLLNSVVGGGGTFDTILMNEIRVKRGLVYGINSSLQAGRERGTLQFSFTANPKNVRPAVTVLEQQLRDVRSQPLTNAQVDRAKTKIVAGELVNEQATTAIVGAMLNIGTNTLPLDYYKHLRERYGRYTPADLERTAQKYLLPDHLVTVYEGPRF